ncbi:MAG TPA: flagellar basal body rod protein FlgB [Verrucomicrobiae bacterium]|jgi:flagellar basal-body rod protein FlgB|nr:flagellar basal body rod protein FlgB [Verrucomicrobiae bacterium]
MIEALFNQPGYVATKKMMDATVLRQEAIASNIANIETPNYKRMDVAPSFAQELRTALSSKDAQKISSVTPAITEDSSSVSPNRDGNTVQLETEMMNLSQNTLAHALETQLVSGSLLKLRLAITGRSS